ncbi:flagellar basal-body rod protein FlgF [Nitrosomonas eutropha]|uniref:Flagellar basal-body rod protein FlgF n=2 Tax=Nitrosomonas eutropha TaxID=916 RepID=A0ABX5M5I1_9PROT|nr:flagellar basal-body rod protein FlgF [Nitrosomonas eutropha]ABI58619.1 flagellar basal-body rod protein FlgF [Nitrosomonas eutropha C91]PXV79698.1 flagellar basal-body rod protein FlgF [Nitrosomonas eutropha]SCX23915.1 flagellar basal-body rod protein FlgF [Nitrosomonas eutropha]SEJ03724.1 flagellar basal-body rod protein FlgF [Nitrosomonas eutropha]
MDRLIYTAMTGALHTLTQQATVSHNLANASTTGFRAQADAFRAVPVYGESLPTRAFVLDSTTGADFTPGAIQQTDRPLDVAIQGSGWITVQLENGEEAYTRHGNLKTDANGVLQTQQGFNIKGETGPITIPPDSRVAIGKDGSVSVLPSDSRITAVSIIGRIKLVDPPAEQLVRGDDGLFRLKQGGEAPASGKVALIDGALESSNVNAVSEMVKMITLARQFDMQMKMLENAQQNAQQASEIMTLRG